MLRKEKYFINLFAFFKFLWKRRNSIRNSGLQHCGLVKDCLCILGAKAIVGMASVGCENQTREQLRAVSPVTGRIPWGESKLGVCHHLWARSIFAFRGHVLRPGGERSNLDR